MPFSAGLLTNSSPVTTTEGAAPNGATPTGRDRKRQVFDAAAIWPIVESSLASNSSAD